MAREQGDELGDEVAYTHPDFERTETAYTATDRVNLEARGWVRKQSPKGKPGSGKAAGTTAESEHA